MFSLVHVAFANRPHRHLLALFFSGVQPNTSPRHPSPASAPRYGLPAPSARRGTIFLPRACTTLTANRQTWCTNRTAPHTARRKIGSRVWWVTPSTGANTPLLRSECVVVGARVVAVVAKCPSLSLDAIHSAIAACCRLSLLHCWCWQQDVSTPIACRHVQAHTHAVARAHLLPLHLYISL